MNSSSTLNNSAYLVGAIGGAVAGGIIVGAGYLAVTGLRAAAKLFARDAEKLLRTPSEPEVDMEAIFDQLGVQKEVEGRTFLADLSPEDSGKVLDLLSGERREGVDYRDFKLCRSGTSILETDGNGEIVNNQFENPLSDPRIVNALNSAIKNRRDGVPVGSTTLLDANIPDAAIKDLVSDVVSRIAVVEGSQAPNQVAEILIAQENVISPDQLPTLEELVGIANFQADDIEVTTEVEETLSTDESTRLVNQRVVNNLLAIDDQISTEVYNGEDISIVKSPVLGDEDAYKLTVLSAPGATILEGSDEAVVIDDNDRVAGIIPNQTGVFLKASTMGVGEGLVEKTLIEDRTGAVLMSVVVNGENDISINTSDISADMEQKLDVALGHAAQSLSSGKQINGALAPVRAVDRSTMLSANSLQNALHDLRDFQNGDTEDAIDHLNKLSREKLEGKYQFQYSGGSKKRTIECLEDGTVVCKFSSQKFTVQGKSKDRKAGQEAITNFVKSVQAAGIGREVEPSLGIERDSIDAPQISEKVQVRRPTQSRSKSLEL